MNVFSKRAAEMSIYRVFFLFFTLIAFLLVSTSGKVLELSDRFLDVSKEGMWLVKFYAPWCGHCKRLEPIWNQVAQSLHFTGVRVGRVDCTRFSAVASEYNIRGFPTVLFLKGDKTYTYKGDRTRDEIVDFALRLEGSAVKSVKDQEEFEHLTSRHEVFFLIVSNENDSSDLSVVYNEISEKYQAHAYFYSATMETVPNQFKEAFTVTPVICVFKDGAIEQFEPLVEGVDNELNVSLATWVSRERFPFFVKVTHGSLPQMLKTEKRLVVAVLDENLIGQFTPEMEEFRDMVKSVALVNKDEFKIDFLFGWTPHASLASSIAMQQLPAPGLIVIDSVSYDYYIPDDDPSQLTPDAITEFLRQIQNKSAKVYGGSGIFTKIYRVYYDATTSLIGMWQGNPVLTTVLFGLPFGFLLLICYSICCADILDASDEDDGRDEDAKSRDT